MDRGIKRGGKFVRQGKTGGFETEKQKEKRMRIP
jgi:hypothetical protein